MYPMNILVYAISVLLGTLGLLAVVLGPWLPGSEEAGRQRTVLGFVLLSWGVAFGFYRMKSYRGGAASIVGLLLLGIGISYGIGNFLWRTHATEKDFLTNVFASVFLIVAGVALLWQGHKVHKSKQVHSAYDR